MASIYGPWAVPPACNTTAQCQEWLASANPNIATGRATCYEELRSANLGQGVAFGGCACESAYALGGNACNDQTTASPAAIACEAVSFAVASLIILRFLPTLLGVFRHKSVWKINAAGTSYLFAWVALIFAWINNIASLVRTLYFSQGALQTLQVTGRLQIIFLIVAVLNLVGAFVEMSYSVRLIQNVDKLRIPVFMAVFGSAALIILTFLFASATTSAAIGFVVIMILAMCGIVGPILLYVKASKRMARTEGTKEPTVFELLTAIVSDVLCAKGQMKRLLGFTKSNSSLASKNSRDSREDGTPQSQVDIPRTPSKQEIKRTSKKLATETEQKLTYLQKQEEKMISFLSRAVTMGIWLFACLLGFLGGIGWGIILGDYFDTNANLRLWRLAELVQAIFLLFAIYQILWFLNIGYQKAISARRRLSRYRSESKDMAPSKEDGSKLEVHDGSKLDTVHTGNISRENSKITSGIA